MHVLLELLYRGYRCGTHFPISHIMLLARPYAVVGTAADHIIGLIGGDAPSDMFPLLVVDQSLAAASRPYSL
jgi:hypothetical protein